MPKIYDPSPDAGPAVTTYWMVHNATSGDATRHRHDTLNDAVKEAKRLAFNCPGSYFTVLQVVDCFMKRPDTMRVAVISEQPF